MDKSRIGIGLKKLAGIGDRFFTVVFFTGFLWQVLFSFFLFFST